MNKNTKMVDIVRYQNGLCSHEADEIAEEFPLTLMVNGEEFATMVCSPTNLEHLVYGFLASEGVIRTAQDVKQLSIDSEKGFAYTELHKPLNVSEKTDKRWIGSCCGKSRSFYFQSDAKTAKTVMSQTAVSSSDCLSLMNAFQEHADLFHKTGGVHQVGLATAVGLECTFADIGRHNALDKLYGYILNKHISTKNKIIIFSGRISSEVLLKVSKMGIGLLLSKSAPTHLALQLAHDLNITAVGFVRGNRMNVYTHHDRIYGQLHDKKDSL
ncbi:formate dehydrogenase accessory sulfurtransferase FdhD [Thalassobacillus sp. CUG 92003]|uniref:formate dehydrogenase accessory sulfurtransferase FdhD n=1 Tax=Thalassobacillus sp. CUG 92003 TaxID=2736641 RepID=UPI0015E73D0D|nr:formate dehydrogenase accessory sulfurtransferase FdhD [Thalassobacillus sp. CUG 92003]